MDILVDIDYKEDLTNYLAISEAYAASFVCIYKETATATRVEQHASGYKQLYPGLTVKLKHASLLSRTYGLQREALLGPLDCSTLHFN